MHTHEIPAADLVPGANEIETYLNTTRKGIRRGTPGTPVRRQRGGWSITFARGRGDIIVGVTDDGVASLATYIPRAR